MQRAANYETLASTSASAEAAAAAAALGWSSRCQNVWSLLITAERQREQLTEKRGFCRQYKTDVHFPAIRRATAAANATTPTTRVICTLSSRAHSLRCASNMFELHVRLSERKSARFNAVSDQVKLKSAVVVVVAVAFAVVTCM